MEFEWDEAKRLKVLADREVDFLDMTTLFDGRPAFTYPSPRGDENRQITIAEFESKLFAVIWVERDGTARIISARRAWHAEERKYRALHG